MTTLARRCYLPWLVAACVLLLAADGHCASWMHEDDGTIPQAPRRQLLQRLFQFDCVGKKCGAETAACTKDPNCAQWLGCAGKCTPLLTPKNVSLHYPCQVKCMFRFGILQNPNAVALNTCVMKNNCTTIVTLGAKICLPPKDGPSKVKLSDLKGRYNVLAGANHLVNCQPSQLRFGYPKPGQFIYKEAPSYLPNKTVVTTNPTRILSYKDGFTSTLGDFAGLPQETTYVILDATKGNEYVLVMYCTRTDVIHAGYVLAKEGPSSIPAGVRNRFARKLVSSVWAAYYDYPLRSFCNVKPYKFY